MESTTIDYSLLARELVRGVRGRRSQTALNRRLEYRSNQIHRWESGQREISWSQFLQLCSTCRRELYATLRNALFYMQPIAESKLFVAHLMLGHSTKETAKRIGISSHTLNRWLKGRSEPTLNEVLKLMALTPGSLENWSMRFCAYNGMERPTQLTLHQFDDNKVIFRYPFAGAVTSAMELAEFRSLRKDHSRWLSDLLSIDVLEVEQCLEDLRASGFIEKDKKGHFRVLDRVIDTSGYDPRERIQLRAYWYQRFFQAILATNLTIERKSRLSFFMHAFSDQAYEAALERLRLAYREIDLILRSDTASEKTRICYLGLDMIDLSELGFETKEEA